MNKFTRSLAALGLAVIFSTGAVFAQTAPGAPGSKSAFQGKKVVAVKAHDRVNKKTGKVTHVKASTRTISAKKPAAKTVQVKGYTKVNKKTGKVTMVKGYTRKAPKAKAPKAKLGAKPTM